MTERTKDVLWLIFVAGFVLLCGLLLVANARADCTLVFGAEWCRPCKAMRPIEEQLRSEGQILRSIDIDQQPELARAYRVGRIPCFIRVVETPQGNFEVGRITGMCTAGQLRRLTATPGVTTVGAAARACVRSILGSPTPIFPEW